LYASDKTLVCQDCNQEFVFSASEQAFFAERQFSEAASLPFLPRSPQGPAR